MSSDATERLVERRTPVFEELPLLATLVSRAMARRSPELSGESAEPVRWTELVRAGSVFSQLIELCGLDDVEAAFGRMHEGNVLRSVVVL